MSQSALADCWFVDCYHSCFNDLTIFGSDIGFSPRYRNDSSDLVTERPPYHRIIYELRHSRAKFHYVPRSCVHLFVENRDEIRNLSAVSLGQLLRSFEVDFISEGEEKEKQQKDRHGCPDIALTGYLVLRAGWNNKTECAACKRKATLLKIKLPLPQGKAIYYPKT